jgi:hypothetical protein
MTQYFLLTMHDYGSLRAWLHTPAGPAHQNNTTHSQATEEPRQLCPGEYQSISCMYGPQLSDQRSSPIRSRGGPPDQNAANRCAGTDPGSMEERTKCRRQRIQRTKKQKKKK